MSGALGAGLPTGPFAVDPATIPYWSAARLNQLVLPWCPACDAPFWYPRGFCPRCGVEDVQWRPATGRGRVETSTVVRRAGGAWAAHVPFAVAVVGLDDGVSITANVIDIPERDLAPGVRVTAVFEHGSPGDLPALRFCPDRSAYREE